MQLGPPGQDPVADHTWCCEHPEPWRYFRPDAEARLLSGLQRVYRIDPVEAGWSLRIVHWTASPDAIPVLARVVSDDALPPRRRAQAQTLLRTLEGTKAEAPKEPMGAEPTQNSSNTPTLLKKLTETHDRTKRAFIVDELSLRFDTENSADIRLDILCELLGERHPDRATLLEKSLRSEHRIPMSNPTRSRLILACATARDDSVLEHMHDLLDCPNARPDSYDVYEAIKALVRAPPKRLDESYRRELLNTLRRQHWWEVKSDEERGQARVIEAALGGIAPPRWRLWGSPHAAPLRYVAEALGFLETSQAIRRLGRLLRDGTLSVRSQAARSLRRIGTSEAARTLAVHVRDDVLPGRVPYDIEGISTVTVTIDAVISHQLKDAANLLYDLLHTPTMQAHDIPERCAIGLSLLNDPRCMDLHGPSGLPALIHAALSRIPLRSPSPLLGHLHHAIRWLIEHQALPMTLPSTLVPPHGERVALSRSLLAWSDARTPGD